MSYIALYRKWRPLVFEEVVEQKHVIEALKNSGNDPAAACEALIDRALKSGGRDNISVAIGFFLAEGGCDG